MRIVQLTPGTGNFHCGSCLRDHGLVRALRRQGHDALMAPMYLPQVLEEGDAPPTLPLSFGGINVYLQHVLPALRWTPGWLDRWLNHPRLLAVAARKAGMTRASALGELTLSMIRGEEGQQRKELAKLTAMLRQLDPRPDVVMLSNAMLIGLARQIRREVGAQVVCTLQGEDTFLDALPAEHREACWAELARRSEDIAAFIAVSGYHAGIMGPRLQIPPPRLHVVHNGIELPDADHPGPAAPVVGYLARMCPPKGLGTLVEAFIHLCRDGRSGVELRIVGAMTAADEPYVASLRRRLADAGLAEQARWHPNVDAATKWRLLRSMSVMSVPATYGESFGLYVLEALSCGIPVVQPGHGAFPELLSHTGGGVLCQPDDPVTLAEGLATLLDDEKLRVGLGRQGQAAVREKFTVDHMASAVAAICAMVHQPPLKLVRGVA